MMDRAAIDSSSSFDVVSVPFSNYSARVYRLIFIAAAAYNIAFGLWAALRPGDFFRLFDLEPPRYPAIWACLAMVIGLYGIGYAYAARHLDRAFPFIAIGLAGKVLGPLGWFWNVNTSDWPARTFPLIAFNDLIWWTPFTLFLLEFTRASGIIKRHAPEICAVSHAIAGIGTVLLLREGSEAIADRGQRLAYITAHPERWSFGWILWMLAAATLLGFYAWWGRRLPRTTTALAAFGIACLGIVSDFAGESLLIAFSTTRFDQVTPLASLLMGGAANGLYTIAGIILTLATPAIPTWLRSWTWLTWVCGIALTFFTIIGSSAGIVASSAALILTFTPWVWVFGRSIR